jgi:hypothetical protein
MTRIASVPNGGSQREFVWLLRMCAPRLGRAHVKATDLLVGVRI